MSNKKIVSRSLCLLALISLASLTTTVQAKCGDEARAEAQKLRSLAADENNDDEAVFLLRTSAQVCEDYATWMDLGRLEVNRGASDIAADYFSRARDMYTPDENGELSAGKLRRLGTANALLADALIEAGKIADALQALEAAKRYFAAYRTEQPQRVLQLQARIDDEMSTASAPTLTRSLKLQRSGSTRGVGIRQKIEETSDEFVAEDATMLAEEQLDELVEDEPLVVASNDAGTSAPSTESTASETDTNALLQPPAAPQTPAIQNDVAAVTEPTSEATSNENSAEAQTTGSESSRLNIQVLFEFDSAEIDSSGETQVQKIAEALKALELPDGTPVKIIGHTDITGNAAYNLALSEKRAISVADSIRSQVSEIQITPVGMGETDIRYPGTSSDDHRRNRRVEIVVN